MKRDELEGALAIALAAAREAGAFVRSGYRTKPAVEHKGVVDLVTHFDRESETILRDRLAALPYAFVGEESSFASDASERAGELEGARLRAPSNESAGGVRADEATLFVDPIDGTTNFVHGHPFWCVSIGLVVRGEPVLGIIVAPVLGLEYWGWVSDDGERAAVRRSDELETASVSEVARFEDSLLATGFPHDRKTSPDNNFDAFVAIKRKCQAVRRCGSAALDLCLVADGTYEGYWEKKLRPWDIAGGTAIVRAAGGRVTDFDGGSSFIASGHCIATNGRIHDALLQELARVQTVDARRDS